MRARSCCPRGRQWGWLLPVFAVGCAATTVGPSSDGGGVRDAVTAVDAPGSADIIVADVIDMAAQADAATGDVGCRDGMTACDGACVDLHADDANCGACGCRCPSGNPCVAGECSVECVEGESVCGTSPSICNSGECVNEQTDTNHCGACGVVCCDGTLCSEGVCTGDCQMGQTLCGPITTTPCVSPGACRDLQVDNSNCGTCGHACATGQVCSMGLCMVSCSFGQTNCSGACVDTTTDPGNCGACGQTCCAGDVCSGGACGPSCPSPSTACIVPPSGGCAGGYCANLDRDPSNCGACGNVCIAGTMCSAGSCGTTCGTGLTNCSGTCVDTMNDNANCGGCGNVCCPGLSCSAGECSGDCESGITLCSLGTSQRSDAGCWEVPFLCPNQQTDNAHCGSCTTVCPPGTFCASGACASLVVDAGPVDAARTDSSIPPG